MNLRRVYAVFLARTREFYRDTASLMWNVTMPVLVVFAFAVIFQSGPEDVFKIGVAGEPTAQIRPALLTLPHVRAIPVGSVDEGVRKVERHQLDLFVAFGEQTRYWINAHSAKGPLAERLLLDDAPTPNAVSGLVRETVSGQALRYVDWVIPGVLAMNMMFSALWGVGYVIVRYRKNGVLRRFRATPLTAAEFLTAQVLSRLFVLVAVSVLVYGLTDRVLGFTMRGSYALLLLILVTGGFSLIGVGLLVASRTHSEELADGLLNLISWPMMVLSGVWFSLEGSPAFIQQVAWVFPLTHVLEAARAVMLDGAGLDVIWPQLAWLLGMALVLLAIAARIFRWQ